ncbi:MAG: hypothetical protein RR413_05670 [Christensenellaceae bacterium]
MTMLQNLSDIYGSTDCRDLGSRQLEMLRDGLKQVSANEIKSAEDGKCFINMLRKFREAVAENDKLHGENYPQLLNSLLSVGEDGLYSNSLRFIFELIQNVDDCEFLKPDDCKLDMRFDFNSGEIVLTYNEVGFTPFNVFAITGIAEAAKNVSASKNEIGEKGIGFKSVFGVARRVLIRSGWFSFELYKGNFTIPVESYKNNEYCPGTQMTLYVLGRAQEIYRQIKDQYCRKESLFGKNPLLFLNKLTSLKLYYDTWRSMEFKVSRTAVPDNCKIYREDDVKIAVNLRDYYNGLDRETIEEITCTRYTYPVIYSRSACQTRYGEKTLVGGAGGKSMLLQAVVPYAEDVEKVGDGGLYSFLPTQLAFTVPVVCHAPFKLDASREFVDPQDKESPGGNLWFKETSGFLAELMDYVYPDWAKTVKQNIVYFLPAQSSSLFSKNNGKEKCLSSQNLFKGSRYLTLPLFLTIDGNYKQSTEVFSFDSAENISEPAKVAEWIESYKMLFMIPENMSAGKFGITIEQNVYNRLFRYALFSPIHTSDILEYLESVRYEYSEKEFPTDDDLKLDSAQIECIMRYKRLADIVLRISNDAVRSNRRPRFSIVGTTVTSISEVLCGGFELSETPRIVENYMKYCKEACVCLNIAENRYIPCHNGIVLSKENPLSSFAAFCYGMDSRDTFAIRIKLREASNQLNQCIENNSGTAADYIRDLRNIRLTVKDSLGTTGYKSYLDLILKSGTDRTRFIQELLQNADDCVYPHGRIPSFTLTQRENSIITEYNEAGFTRANIRSITAIGESTKNRLLNGDLESIGEKGIGFKTVFASASEVKIYSGEYNFALTANEPTIPHLLVGTKEHVNGTRMDIALKDRSVAPSLKPADILELCLCLRQLKEIDINGHKITITDSDTQRTITLDKRPYVFSKYIHPFAVTDKKALEDRQNATRVISPNQQIVCYVPDKTAATDYPLYTGFPTKHRIRIPMVIDAPYELTTSREEIEVDCASWNDIVRKEMYNAIIEVIHSRKTLDKANVLRFARFKFQISGNQRMYVNDLSDLPYLNVYDYLTKLRSETILPTFDKTIYVSASGKSASLYPKAATLLLSELTPDDYGALQPKSAINPELEGVSKEQKERIDAIFNALACEVAPFTNVFPLLQKHAESFIEDADFRNCLYEYLQDIPEEYRIMLIDLNIIPVYGKAGGSQYISWVDDGIFVKKNTRASDKSYWVLNEALLSKAMCEKMLGVNINEMNAEWERSRYRSALQETIKGNDVTKIYKFLASEFACGALQKNDCLSILLGLKDVIPLKNELGEINDTELFLCGQPRGYFAVKMIQRLAVHKECAEFAEYIKCRNLSDIYYEDVDYYEQLTADDIESLQDDYFIHSDEILRGFYRNGYLSDELLEQYDLKYLGMGRTNDSYTFPEKPVRDRMQLIQHIKTVLQSPVTVFTAKVVRSVLKGRRNNGVIFDLSGNDARNNTLQIYTPEAAKKIAFCQMCLIPKPYMLMEVNNLELNPRYYFHQTRIALCLECSKRFEALREKDNTREEYMKAICSAVISQEGKVEIPVGHEYSLTFTATHLAEVQEILKNMPK